ncbi:MAG: ribosome recycling factor [candidate division Zixibacteria bacterium]|nr:ribosome recycling factor [candidate division Zixibacteria bacterium]
MAMAGSAEGIKSGSRERMQKAVAATRHELATIRTGKASVALLDSVRVTYYGNPVPLNQVASISAPEPRLLLVQPWEKPMVPEIIKSIQKAELGLNPVPEGNLIRLPIPPLNEERRRDLVKLVKKHAEEGRIAIRNIRRDANDHLKKAEKDKELSEDDHHRTSDEIQKFTDSFIAEVDKLVTAKEAEIMEV